MSAAVFASCFNWRGTPDALSYLRHGAVSLIAARGTSARVAVEILGHAKIGTTMNIHTHIAPEL